MKKQKKRLKHKHPPNQREVVIDHKTTILTSSTKSDDVVREEYLEKITRGVGSQHKRNLGGMNKNLKNET